MLRSSATASPRNCSNTSSGSDGGGGGGGGGGGDTLLGALEVKHSNVGGGGHSYEGKIAGLYDLEETLGRGHFAVVKLARHVFTGERVAVKVIDKTKLDEVSKAHLFQEVRCMKLVQHPNVVRLYEVIDTATKLYLILEWGDGGDLYDYIMRHESGLSEQLACDYFRQIVRAIMYCHQLHVVHRDLKPENVVFFQKLGVVKLTDFGFSNKFCPGQKLETSCGSLAYSAPEILLGESYDAPAVDVWSLGVILYMLVCGQAPFQEANDSETLTMIMDCKYSIPEHVSTECRQLIEYMLVKKPEKRATLIEIANHKWLISGGHQQNIIDVQPLVSKIHLNEDDHNFIIQKMVNGTIASKEEIQECLDRNDYNHITATYYLLAERKLRSKRQQESLSSIKNNGRLSLQNTLLDQASKMNLLNVPRLNADLPVRVRKCSIVQEDEEDEEDISRPREDLVPALNRRGSRSEGRLNLTVQERLTETTIVSPVSEATTSTAITSKPTVVIPTPLIQISEEHDSNVRTLKPSECYTSYSSSDDEDENCENEQRKKRLMDGVMTLSTTSNEKPKLSRRDSHDDSSDSQETANSTSRTTKSNNTKTTSSSSSNTTSGNSTKESKYKKTDSSKSNNSSGNKTGKKCTGKRLRQSQSLNRISEVQEDISVNTKAHHPMCTNQTLKDNCILKNATNGITRFFHGFGTNHLSKKVHSTYRLLDSNSIMCQKQDPSSINTKENGTKNGLKKVKLLTKYFQMHKKLYIPLSSIFTVKNHLYKTRSCGSVNGTNDEKIDFKVCNTHKTTTSREGAVLLRKCEKHLSPRVTSVTLLQTREFDEFICGSHQQKIVTATSDSTNGYSYC